MRFLIQHHTSYRYSCPVRLGPHRLRVVPQSDERQRLLAHRIDIDPEPCSIEEGRDALGNRVHQAAFAGETWGLDIRVTLEVATHAALQIPIAAPLPPDYGPLTASLASCLASLEEPQALLPFLGPLLSMARGDTGTFLDALNQAVHRLYHQGVRPEGPPQRPAQTLALGHGVCRDLALLFMAATRQAGIASRFVSGYQAAPAAGPSDRRHLHAWAEVHLPGLGWQGYDPTHGHPVADRHVAVAAAPDPEEVTPVAGGFWFSGERVTSTLEADVRIHAEET
jgi:transglutaminase-like putative cysteine protease